MTSRSMLYISAAIALVIVIAIGAMAARQAKRPHDVTASSVEAVVAKEPGHAPDGARIRVEVINTTRTRGLARRATDYLRDLGYDVVAVGTSSATRDSTIVIDRTGHADWSRALAEALHAKSATQLDASRYVDVTVLLGSDWRAPTQPLYP